MKYVICVNKFPGTFSLIKKIVKHTPTEINKVNEYGWTALMIACRNVRTYSNIEVVKLLLDNGADPNIKSTVDDLSAMAISIINCDTDSNLKTIKLLINAGTKCDINLILACRFTNNYKLIKLLIDQNIYDINKVSNKTALISACDKNNIDIVNLLLLNGADVNKADDNGVTPLMTACDDYDANIDLVTLLIDNGANITATDILNCNALVLVCKKIIYGSLNPDRLKIVESLLENGIDTTYVKYKNDYLLSYVCGEIYINEYTRASIIENLCQLIELLFEYNTDDEIKYDSIIRLFKSGVNFSACTRFIEKIVSTNHHLFNRKDINDKTIYDHCKDNITDKFFNDNQIKILSGEIILPSIKSARKI